MIIQKKDINSKQLNSKNKSTQKIYNSNKIIFLMLINMQNGYKTWDIHFMNKTK